MNRCARCGHDKHDPYKCTAMRKVKVNPGMSVDRDERCPCDADENPEHWRQWE